MCGICGLIDYKRPLVKNDLLVKKMATRLVHRGPDSINYSLTPHNHFGHTRLSIIDLKTGDQPVFNSDKSICTVFNGEIYNYLELKRDFLSDYPFYTESDTEVIVALYEKYGIDFIQYLNGQFAIALYDLKQEKTYLIRDRVGISPLYYSEVGSTFYFASEIKSLLAAPEISASMNMEGFLEFIHLWTPLTPNTLFENILEVSPGCYLEIDALGSRNKRYWDFHYHPQDCRLNLDQATDQLDDLLDDSVRIRLRSDVPVGAYLSGGLDSSIILSYLTRQDQDLSTFSLTFSDEGLNEESFQQEVSRHFSTRHQSVKADYYSIADNFIRCIQHTESPLFRTSPTPMMLLSEKVHNSGYKVVLTGEGSDEVFGGYDIFKEAKIREFWSRNPDSAWRASLLQRLYPYLDIARIQSPDYLKQAFGHKLTDTEDLLYAFHTRAKTTSAVLDFLASDRKSSMSEGMETRVRKSFPVKPGQFGVFNLAQYIESRTIMPGYILSSQGDRMLMANSVEGRYPFLDHRVIEFAQGLKNSFKMNGLNEKYILKRLVKNRIPKSVINRPKQPYRSPDINALMCSRDNHLLDFLSVDEINKNGVFDPTKVQMLIKKVRAGRAKSMKDNMLFTIILSTQIWFQEFINN